MEKEFSHSLKFRGKIDPKEDEEFDIKIEKNIWNFEDLIWKKIKNSIQKLKKIFEISIIWFQRRLKFRGKDWF